MNRREFQKTLAAISAGALLAGEPFYRHDPLKAVTSDLDVPGGIQPPGLLSDIVPIRCCLPEDRKILERQMLFFNELDQKGRIIKRLNDDLVEIQTIIPDNCDKLPDKKTKFALMYYWPVEYMANYDDKDIPEINRRFDIISKWFKTT